MNTDACVLTHAYNTCIDCTQSLTALRENFVHTIFLEPCIVMNVENRDEDERDTVGFK